MPRNRLDRGLAAAFGAAPDPDHPTVFDALRAREDSPPDSSTASRAWAQRYETGEEIGRGRHSRVLLAADRDLGREVAMKVLDEAAAQDPHVLSAFVEEAQITAQLQHPGVVPVFELGLRGEQPYFVMRPIKGTSLADLLAERGHGRGLRGLLDIFTLVCQAMAYAHARRVVHGRLCAEKIQVGRFGEVQVLDWGAARIEEHGGTADEVAREARPPEAADRSQDVHALGQVLHEILTRARRGADGTPETAAPAAGEDDELWQLCRDCLEPSPADRPGSALELLQRIERYQTQVAERGRAAELAASRVRARLQVTRVAAAAAALLLGALGLSLWSGARQARADRADAEARVASALDHVRDARRQGAPERWTLALASAEQAQDLSRDPLVSDETRTHVEELVEDVRTQAGAAAAHRERLARDAAMQTRLEQLRWPKRHDTWIEGWDRKENERLDRAYQDAFHEFLGGRSPLSDDLAQIAPVLRESTIRQTLIASLDLWFLARRGLAEPDASAPGARKLLQLADLLDAPESPTAELRRMLADEATKPETLTGFAERTDLDDIGVPGLRVLALELWHRGEKRRATEVLEAAIVRVPDAFDLHFLLVRFKHLGARVTHEQCLRSSERAAAVRPDNVEIQHRRAMTLQFLKRIEDARRVFQALSDREPRNGHWLYHLGQLYYYNENDVARAVELFREAREVDPSEMMAHLSLAEVLINEGQPREGLEAVQQAKTRWPEERRVAAMEARAFLNIGYLKRAEAASRAVLHRDPDDQTALVTLSSALMHQQRFEEAVEALRGRVDKRSFSSLRTLIKALIDAGRLDEARERMSDLRVARTFSFEAYKAVDIEVLAAQLEIRSGHRQAGRRILEEALKTHPESEELKVELGRLLSTSSRSVLRQQARRLFASEFEHPSYRFQARFELGMDSLWKLHDYPHALECFLECTRLQPATPEPWFNIGEARRLSGDYEGAIESFGRAAELFAPFSSNHAIFHGNRARENIGKLRAALPLVRAFLEGSSSKAEAPYWYMAQRLANHEGRLQELVDLTKRMQLDHLSFSRERSARAAVLLSAKEGTPPARAAELRRLAFGWLRADLDQTAARGVAGELRESCGIALRHRAYDIVRGDALARLPEKERAAWEKLWDRYRRYAGEEAR